MPRAMWRGAISFGMVAIPVRLYLATESKRISFRLLCPEHHTPVKNKRWCPEGDHELQWNETIRGFEVAKDDYVEISDHELDELPLTTSKAIDILEFCPDEQIDAAVYIDSAYYLEPEQTGAKPYSLMRQALEATGKVAIGKIAFRDREHLCRIALHRDGLILNTLHWPDEVRDIGELNLPSAEQEANKREIDMAMMLVENLSTEFDPERYHDEYREAVVALAEAKMNEQPLPKANAEPEGKIMDLMAALKASVEATSGKNAKTATHKTANADDDDGDAHDDEHTATAARTSHPGRKRAAS